MQPRNRAGVVILVFLAASFNANASCGTAPLRLGNNDGLQQSHYKSCVENEAFYGKQRLIGKKQRSPQLQAGSGSEPQGPESGNNLGIPILEESGTLEVTLP